MQGCIDPPEAFSPTEDWEKYLDALRRSPQDDPLVRSEIARAERVLAERRPPQAEKDEEDEWRERHPIESWFDDRCRYFFKRRLETVLGIIFIFCGGMGIGGTVYTWSPAIILWLFMVLGGVMLLPKDG